MYLRELRVGRGGDQWAPSPRLMWGSGKSGTSRQEDQLDLGTELGWYGRHQASQYGTAPTMSAFPECLLPYLTLSPRDRGEGQEGILLPGVQGMAGLGVSGQPRGLGSSLRDPQPQKGVSLWGAKPTGVDSALSWTKVQRGWALGGWVGGWVGWRLHSGPVPDLTAQPFKCPCVSSVFLLCSQIGVDMESTH